MGDIIFCPLIRHIIHVHAKSHQNTSFAPC
jgi:hypothetical protein